jgi:hypothetical protein
MSVQGNQPQVETRSSRRALMAGALGGLGALAATAVGIPRTAQAATGDALRLGTLNSAGTITTLTRVGADRLGHGLKVVVARASAVAVKAQATDGRGVDGSATSGIGVAGGSNTGVGVFGSSVRAPGVWAASQHNTAMFARSAFAVGIHAIGGGGQGVIGNGVIGVEGNTQARRGWGVGGVNTAEGGTGVRGQARGPGSRAVAGFSNAGHAIHGESAAGWAGFFDGRVFLNEYAEFREASGPVMAPRANRARLFVRNGPGGRTQLCVRFHTGAVRILASQP